MLDLFQLQEQFVRMPVGSSAVFAAIIREHGGDPGSMFLEGRQHVVVHDVHGGDRQLRSVERAPGVTRVAVDDGLQVDLADALEMTDEEGVHGHQVAGIAGLDMAFAELGREPLQQPDLLVGEVDLGARDVRLQAQQALVLGQQIVGGSTRRVLRRWRPECPAASIRETPATGHGWGVQARDREWPARSPRAPGWDAVPWRRAVGR